MLVDEYKRKMKLKGLKFDSIKEDKNQNTEIVASIVRRGKRTVGRVRRFAVIDYN